MNLRRTLAVMRKESWHVLRDRTAFSLTLLSPAFLLVALAYTLSVQVREVAVAVLDGDRTLLSRQYVQGLGASGDVVVRYRADDYVQVKRWLLHGQAKAAVIIPAGFEADLRAGRQPALQVLVEGTDPNAANVALAHISGYSQRFIAHLAARTLARAGLPAHQSGLLPVELRLRVWYNPTLKLLFGLLPAFIAVVLGMPAVAATTALVREKEQGTFEQLVASPIRRAELIVGKLVPYIVSGMLSTLLCTAVAVFWFGSPFRGSLGLYLLLSADFFLATMAIALIISALTGTQQAAQIGAVMIFFFPGLFLSGIFYPIFSMEPMMKIEAFMVPTTHYVFIGRGIFLKGQGMALLWPYALALLVMGFLFLSMAVLLFRKRLG